MLGEIIDAKAVFQFACRIMIAEPAAEANPAVFAGAVAEVIAVGDEAIYADFDGRGDHTLLGFTPRRLIDAGVDGLQIDPATAQGIRVGCVYPAGMLVEIGFLKQVAYLLCRSLAKPLFIPQLIVIA